MKNNVLGESKLWKSITSSINGFYKAFSCPTPIRSASQLFHIWFDLRIIDKDDSYYYFQKSKNAYVQISEKLLDDARDYFEKRWLEMGLPMSYDEPVDSCVIIDDIEVPTKIKEFTNFNIIMVEVGSNGLQGGDSGSGGRTYVSISNESSTDLRMSIIEQDSRDERSFEDVSKFEIIVGGDAELRTFAEAFLFIGDELMKKVSGLED